MPTETVYGLAANALDARACRGIFRAKRRPASDPLIVHVPSLSAAENLAMWNDDARALARRFWPGPLTIVLPRRAGIPDVVTSGRDTVALRCPGHPLALRLLRLARVPLAAPSANPFGYVSPTTAADVLDGLGDRIDWILDGGRCAVGVESTIIDVRRPGCIVVLRPGGVGVTALGAVLPGARLILRSRSRAGAAALAPGMFARHYSPRATISLHAPGSLGRRAMRAPAGTAVVLFRKPPLTSGSKLPAHVLYLTKRGTGAEAARTLFSVLRRLDREGFRRALVERAPASAGPLAVAINDRLRRAAHR